MSATNTESKDSLSTTTENATTQVPGKEKNGPIFDRRCIITVVNHLKSKLTVTAKKNEQGEWDNKHPVWEVIAPNVSNRFILNDVGPTGAKGYVTYRIGDSLQEITTHFYCPFVGGDNEALWSPTQVGGIELKVQFKVGDNPLEATFEVSKA